jgi:hypothetical protein
MKLGMKGWSNFLFIIPLVFALISRVYVMAIIICLTMIVSLVYHIYREKEWVRFDRVTASTLIIANLVLCYLFRFTFPYFYLALLFVCISFYFYFNTNKKNYQVYHSLWHLSSVLITLFCLMGYINR